MRWCFIIALVSGLVVTFSFRQSRRATALDPTFTPSEKPLPALQGAAAIEHLKQQGHYASLDEAMTLTRYGVRVVPEEQRSEGGTNYVVHNPAQQLRASFAAKGVELQSATQPGMPWRLGMKLRSAGYGNQQIEVSSGAVTAQGNRIEYRRELSKKQQGDGNQSKIRDPQSEIVEWYVNKPSGLEHGFTLADPPGERRAGELLRLTLGLESTLRARAVADGQAVEFVDAAGNVALRYDHLVVWDAHRQSLTTRMRVNGDELTLEVEDAGAVYPLTIDPNFTQQAYLKASNTEASDFFGAVAMSGDTVVVGAYQEDSNATGVNGNQADNSASTSGAAYVFVRSGTTWSQQAYLKASNPGAGDRFGFTVAIAGNTVVVGANGEASNATGVNGDQTDNSAAFSGAAYVFVRSGTTWSQQAYLKASNTAASDDFGISVAVSGDTVAVGARREDSNATGVNGNQSDNSAAISGAAYVFVRSGTTWSQQAYLKASNTEEGDQFGNSIAVAGDTVVVGDAGEDSSATGVNGNQADNSAADSGAACVFVRAGTTWSQQAYLKASNSAAGDLFGFSVAVTGDTVVVGAISEDSSATGVNGNQADNSAGDSGAAYVFLRSGTTWSQQAYLKASNSGATDEFGGKVATSGDTVVVGASQEDSNATGVNGNQADNSAADSGAAYIFLRSGTTWSQQAYLKASNTGVGDVFGSSVATAGDTVVVGAILEDSNAIGVNGNQADNSASTSGAVYLFFGPPLVVTTVADEQNTNGQCSLREALINANNNNQSGSTDCAAGGGVDTITFSAMGTINLTSALPAIVESLTITGPGANSLTVRRDTGGDYRIFNINDGSVSISNLTINNGKAFGGGGIQNVGTLTLTNCVISGNNATDGNGGGIVSTGTLNINNSSIVDNRAEAGGGLFASAGSVTMSNSTVSGNSSSQSGALGLQDVTATLTNCTISGNTASIFPGGIGNRANAGKSASLTVTNCTIANNQSDGTGGGIFASRSTTAISVLTQLKNTILVGNGGANLLRTSSATFTSLGNNLSSDGGGGFLNAAGDLINTNPLLSPLGHYIGDTQTHLLLPGSPAINAGNNDGAPATDQRGVSRPKENIVDIGAVETRLIVVTNTNDAGPGSFRQALIDANATAGLDDILFSLPAGAQIINLAGVLPNFTDNINIFNITGPNNLTVRRDTGGNYRIFTIPGGLLASINGLTITNGAPTSGSVVGAGIGSAGTLSVTNCIISGNTSPGFGGGIYSVGSLTLSNSSISGNHANNAGGIVAAGTLSITNTTISGNTAVFQGGGLQLDSVVATLTNTTISGNSAGTWGGGILHAAFDDESSLLTLSNCTVANNLSNGTFAGGIVTLDAVGGGGTLVTRLRNTIVSNNAGPNLVRAGANATVTSLGYNLATDNGGTFLSATGDLTNANAGLAPLANNGGLTQTHALQTGSLALDAGNSSGSLVDQRGFRRPVDIPGILNATDGADIGAFEAQTLVTNANDNGGGSLRQAIAELPTGSSITFDTAFFNTPRTITLTSGELNIDKNLTITGAGANLVTISGNNQSRVFRIAPGLTVSLSGMTITGGNSGGLPGGGILNRDGSLTVSACNITGNIADDGGGILSDGPLTVLNSTVSNNTATINGNAGGGINSQGTLILTNSTISGNRTTGGNNNGGGVWANGNSTITNSTITNNSTPGANSGGGLYRNAGTVTILNTIIAGNVNNSTVADVAAAGSTGITSSGYNLIGNPGAIPFSATLDQFGTPATPRNPELGLLQINGGTTPTHLPSLSSPALDKGGSGSSTDQRGLARPVNIPGINGALNGNESDVGAVELQPLIVTNADNGGTGSLRQTILDAPANSDILFDSSFFSVPRTITLTSGHLLIQKNLTINGPGANLLTVSGNNQSRVLLIDDLFTVSLSGMTITGGNTTEPGGGIYSAGNLTISNSHITGNTGQFGAGIRNELGSLTLLQSTVSNNTANGNFAAGGGLDVAGPLTVTNSTISGNMVTGSSGNSGGGIWVSGDSTITNSTITNNSVVGPNSASGLLRAGGTVTIRNSIIAGNVNNSAMPDVVATGNTGIASNGYNLIGNVGTVTSFVGIGDQSGGGINPVLSPMLAVLQNNGGPTPTHALLGGSLALDRGHRSGSTIDQRGRIRPFDIFTITPATGGDNSDIGAVEMQSIIVTNANDSGVGSLRQALLDANANGPGQDDIIFAINSASPQIINLASALPSIATSLAINGPGANLLTVRRDTGGEYRIFSVPASNLAIAISGLTISNAFVAGGSVGGGIVSNSALTLTNVAVINNRAGIGGGVHLSGDGTFTGCLFSGNTGGNQGGGINFEGGDGNKILRIINSTVSTNNVQGGGFGGGIFNTRGTVEVRNSTIANNTSTSGNGGGVNTSAVGAGRTATTTLRNSIIADNTAPNLLTSAVSGGLPSMTSQGFNLTNDPTNNFLNQPTDKFNTNPSLAPLADNGGPTQTHALLIGSAALDAGHSSGSTTDQRGIGFPRPIDLTINNANLGNGADIGAFESQTLPPIQLLLDESGPAANQVSALDSVLFLRDPFPVINLNNHFNTGLDPNTRVIVFVMDLQLAQGETASSVVVNLVDSSMTSYAIPAEDVRTVPGFSFVQVLFRLPNNLPLGTCTITVAAQGRTSNSAVFRIRL